jgi:hypothetical protein
MLELLLLPWTIFKYLFSLGLWGIFFMTLHYQWKKHDCSEWTVGQISKRMNKKNKPESPEDYIV